MRRSGFLLALSVLLVQIVPADAQYLYGKNKVIYSPRDWLVSKGEKVELFFYKQEEELAQYALAWGDSSAAELEEVLGLELQAPVPLVLYGSQHAFRETNVIPNLIPESVGGFTDLMRGRVVVPSTGDLGQLRHVIRHEMVHAVMLEKLAQVMNSRRQFGYRHPPLWFVEGLAEYYSVGPPDTEGEMLLREGIIEGNLPTLRNLWQIQGSYLMYKVGQSVLAFLDRNYGTEAVRGLFDNWWRAADFEEVLRFELGMDLDELDRRWRNHLRRRYYPTVTNRVPAPERGRELIRGGGYQFGPAALGDSSFVYLETASGRVGLARADFPDSPRRKAQYELLLEGGHGGHTESIPFMRSRPSGAGGIIALSVQRGPRDELRFLDLRGRELASFAADSLVQIESPSLAADGRVLFSAIQPNGRRDLYLLEGAIADPKPQWRVTRLGNDDFDDRDPCWHPDGSRFLFSSDRGQKLASPHRNLFEMDLASGALRRLTRGPWVDRQPRWDPAGERYLYVSDRLGAWDILMATGGRHERQTACYGGTLDPAWIGEGFLAAVYERGRYRLYHFPLQQGGQELNSRADGDSLAAIIPQPGVPDALPAPVPYRRRWGLDFAQTGLAYDPEFGSAGGGSLGVTDLLGNHQINIALTNTATDMRDFFKRMNVGLGYANLSRRLNWSVALFHLSSDFDRNRWEYRYERRFGTVFGLSYPLNLFQRLELSANFRGVLQEDELSAAIREPEAVLGSLYGSWVHDTVLWGYGGPQTGERINLTLGYTAAFGQNGYGYSVARLDARKYWRLGGPVVYATRLLGHISSGDDPRFVHLGGPLQLRGWPYQHFHARGVWLSNHELRVPLAYGLRLYTPLGSIDLPSVRGSAFFDAARLSQRYFAIPQPSWVGAYGLGLELGLGPVLILRWNFVRITDFEEINPDVQHEFFLGWNY